MSTPFPVPGRHPWVAAILSVVLGGLTPARAQSAPGPNPAGQRMYREGILPSGQAMRSTLAGGAALPGSTFACLGCHQRAGLGKREAGVLTPPINGATLFRPSYLYLPALGPAERGGLPEPIREVLRRPAYTDATLAAAIRSGVDPAGRVLGGNMPRYQLDDQETAALIAYLKSLSAVPSPGVDDTTLRFATVVTDGVSREDRQALLTTLEHQIRLHNNLWQTSQGLAYRNLAMIEPALAIRKWSLAVWELQGPAAGWRAQLEEHEQEGPVFALVGGISYGDWQPVHAFCEAHGLPCVMPITDFPVTTGPVGRTLYFSGGFHLEGGAAAAYLADHLDVLSSGPILQLAQNTPEARALAAGFRAIWSERGGPEPLSIPVPAGGRITGPFLVRLMRAHPQATLLLWAGPEAFRALGELASSPARPARVLMSASYLREAVWDLPQPARPLVHLTYPYRLQKPARAMASSAGPAPVSLVTVDNDRRVRSRAYAVMQVVDEAVTRMGRDFHREHFLDGISLMEDKTDSDFQVLGFGPGRPVLSTGCHLVRLPQGPLHGFIKERFYTLP